MAVIALGNGKGVTWNPTTALQCARCEEAFNPATSVRTVYLMYDGSDPQVGESLRINDYWYFHAHCRDIEKVLKGLGANIRWQAHEMPFILGFSIERDGFRRWYKNRERRAKLFPPGVYEKLCAEWRPALGALDADITTTVDITEVAITSIASIGLDAMPPPVPQKPLDEQPGWLARRYEILARDKYRCRICGTAASDGDHVRLEVDHIDCRKHGGTDDPRNLWTLCFACNRGKGTRSL